MQYHEYTKRSQHHSEIAIIQTMKLRPRKCEVSLAAYVIFSMKWQIFPGTKDRADPMFDV